MGAPAPCDPAPALCLLLVCVWLSRGERAGESLWMQTVGERGVDGGRPGLGERLEKA